MTDEARPSYPPKNHILQDLGIEIERDIEDPARTRAFLDLRPELLDEAGRPRIGALAILADVIAGESAIRAVMPNWAATSDLSISVGELPSQGRVEARLEILRAGRQTIVLEVHLYAEHEPEVSCGLGTLTFSVLPARGNDEKTKHFAAAVSPKTTFASTDSGFNQPILKAICLEPDPEDAAVTRLEVSPYLRNSLGALQGGVGAVLLESTAERFAASQLPGPVRVRSLAIHFLKLGRVGPIRAVARSLAQTPNGLLARVELRDEGVDDALLSVATVQVEATHVTETSHTSETSETTS